MSPIIKLCIKTNKYTPSSLKATIEKVYRVQSFIKNYICLSKPEKDDRKMFTEETCRKDPKIEIEISPPCNESSILRKENICNKPNKRYSSGIEYRLAKFLFINKIL